MDVLGNIVGLGGAGGACRMVPVLRCFGGAIVAYVSVVVFGTG